MGACHLCGSKAVAELLNFGAQPVCSRFLKSPGEDEYAHPLLIGQCDACGIVQITHPVPAGELVPPYPWITYNEPEGHLDQAAEMICGLPNLAKESRICGISYKDDSTLERLRKRGFEHTWRIDPVSDLKMEDPRAGLETIQDRLHPGTAKALARKYGAPDVVIARHILEHAHDTIRFMETLRQLVKPGGYVVFEAPDCTRALETFDYTTVWEEHILYFTPETFRRCFGFGGFSLVRFECYPYAYENSLVGIALSRSPVTPNLSSEDALEQERGKAHAFARELSKQHDKLIRFFSEYRQRHGKIAIFGAGHLAGAFINLMELKEHIEFVVDDHPAKRGLFMPGSRLAIYGSSALIEENIKLCLMSLSPESEEKVVQKNQAFLGRGGVFASIFPASKYALRM